MKLKTSCPECVNLFKLTVLLNVKAYVYHAVENDSRIKYGFKMYLNRSGL